MNTLQLLTLLSIFLYQSSAQLNERIRHKHHLGDQRGTLQSVGSIDKKPERTNHLRRAVPKERNLDLFEQAYANPAFAKCWGVLNDVSASGKDVSKQEYISFLRIMSDGEVEEEEFKDLDMIFVTIFYSAACRGNRDCVGNSSIELASTANGVGPLIGMCYNVMKDLVTKIDFTFEVTVQYDPLSVPEGGIGDCLGPAVESVLLESFGCGGHSRRLSLSNGATHASTVRLSVSEEEKRIDMKPRISHVDKREGEGDLAPLLDRLVLEWSDENIYKYFQRMLTASQSCPYEATAEMLLDRSFFIGCLQKPGLCGIAILRVNINVPQLSAPNKDELKHNAIKALKRAIENGTFGGFFPSACAS
mmetsp:Transcript_18951/g.24387  ORF Transcript_18951/g.24387 Transcript_18951/m.24387 type:complete len:361 (-) Transcript_18951:214-1296(-)|eukprot:CAMPEP_0198150450 /NCGR_PEP_ID=MMETSP1443-20131203/50993_1 /TAXON_ID=186043 /ORGANISM="Entomoneis sp., Strain CCMP2396" /LENGTH=360 /DNA_ID=CAMNT_0043815751 /DNA_START=46 /DNA_END=1128 /DNA_ORIENTATION=+